MPTHPVQTLMLAARRPLVWLIVIAIAVYGHTTTLVQLLGPAHRHELASATAAHSVIERVESTFRDIRQWRAELRARWLPSERLHVHDDGSAHAHDAMQAHTPHAMADTHKHTHAHPHAQFERHHHDPHDRSVVALDGMGDSGAASDVASSQATAGSAMLPLALAPAWALPASPERAPATWQAGRSDRWRDASARLAERPPRA